MVNIIIPLYNSKETLPKTLDSLVAQTKERFFVTLVNDADGNDYSTIIEEYTRRGFHISLIEREENGGPGMARQTGLDASKMFDQVMFLDSDDMLFPRAIEILSEELYKNHGDIISGSFITEENHAPGMLMDSSKIPVQWHHAKLYRRRYLEENNICFHPRLRYSEDAYFNLVACNCTDKHLRIPEICHLWRDNKNSITRKDGISNFCKYGDKHYILGQILAIKKIIEITGTMNSRNLGATLKNIYYAVMRNRHNKNNEDLFIEELHSLREEQVVQNYLNEGANWINDLVDVQAAAVDGTDIYFFKERFVDWITNNIKGEDSDE